MATTLNGIKINGKIESINGVKINGTPVSDWKGVKFYRGSTLIGQYDFFQYLKYTINRGSITLPGTELIPLIYVPDASQDWVELPKDRSDSSTTYGQNIWRGTSGLFRALIAQNTTTGNYPLNAPSDLQVYPEGGTPIYSITINENEADYPEGNLFRWKRQGSLSEAGPTPLGGEFSKYMGDGGLNYFLTDTFQNFDSANPNLDQPRFVLIPSWVNCSWSLDASYNSKIDLNSISYIVDNPPNYPLILFDESGRASGATNVDNVAVISCSRYNLAYAAGVAAAEVAVRLKNSGATSGQDPIIDIVIGNNRLEDRIDLVNAVVQGITTQAAENLSPIINVIDLSGYNAVSVSLLNFWRQSQEEALNTGFLNTDKIIVTDWPEFFEYWNAGDWEEDTNVYGIYFGNAPVVHRYNYWKDPLIDESNNISISSTIQGPVSRLSDYEGRTSKSRINSLIYEIYPNYNFNLADDPANLGSRASEAILGTPLYPDGGDHLLKDFNLTAVSDGGYTDLILAGGSNTYTEGINVIACDAEGNYNGKNIFTYLSNRPQQ